MDSWIHAQTTSVVVKGGFLGKGIFGEFAMFSTRNVPKKKVITFQKATDYYEEIAEAFLRQFSTTLVDLST
jgi:hypothetical protein